VLARRHDRGAHIVAQAGVAGVRHWHHAGAVAQRPGARPKRHSRGKRSVLHRGPLGDASITVGISAAVLHVLVYIYWLHQLSSSTSPTCSLINRQSL
jgi:hypothetical protein